MDSGLSDLLNETAFEANSSSFTYLTTFDSIKRWNLKPNHQTEFWKGYCGLVNNENDLKLCLAERISSETPIIAQFKFRFDVENYEDLDEWECYDDKFLAYLCHIYQCAMIENLKFITDTNLELVAAVFESKTKYLEIDENTKKKYLTFDVKIQFPFTKLNVGIQKRIIRSRVISLLRETKGFSKMINKPVDDWEQIISNDFDSPMMFYGSSKYLNTPKLKLTHSWHLITKEMIDDEDDIVEELEIDELFIPNNHQHVRDGFIEDHIFDRDHTTEFWLPIVFSIDYWPVTIQLKEIDDGRFNVKKQAIPSRKPSNNGWLIYLLEENHLETCVKMVQLINDDNFNHESSWMDIGKAFYRSSDGTKEGLSLWIKYTEKVIKSLQTPKFMLTSGSIEKTASNLYQKFAGKPISHKSMGYCARADNPEEYTKWHKEMTSVPMSKSLSGTHDSVADAIYQNNWLDFLYCPRSKKWFFFKDHRWNEDFDDLKVFELLMKGFVRQLENSKYILNQEMRESTDEDVIANGNSTKQKIDALIMKLEMVPYKKNIKEALKGKFADYKFSKSRNANPYLFGVENGVFEVVGNNIYFRPGKPEDYVTLSTKINYKDNLTWESREVIECMDWFGKVFRDKPLQEHFLKFAASCLKGRNSDKIFPIFTGEGNNSKSMIVKLFMATFGEYAIKFDMSNVTGRNNNASGATPQLARAEAVRIGFMDEAADDIPMHKETIKRVVGGDSFYTRKLHDNGGDIEVFFKLILSCNKVPIIPKADTAIKNRVRIFPFESTWSLNAPPDEEEQYRLGIFPLDTEFESKIDGLAEAFLWIIVQYYPRYAIEKLKDPECVIKKTEDYWKNNDVYAQFAADCIKIVEGDQNIKVSFNEMFTRFKSWFKDSFDGAKAPDKPIIKSEFQSRFGNLVGAYWYGIALIDPEEGTIPVAQRIQSAVHQKIDKPRQSPRSQPVPIAQKIQINLPVAQEKSTEQKIPEAIKYANKVFDKSQKSKDLQEYIGDISTKLLSPGIIAGDSGEINIEDDGAVDL